MAAGVREVMWQAGQDGQPVSLAALAAGVSEMAAWAWIQQRGGVRPRRPGPPSGRFLSLTERKEIAAGAAAGLAVREIARRVSRAAPAVSRELARNRVSHGYRAVAADRLAAGRRARAEAAERSGPCDRDLGEAGGTGSLRLGVGVLSADPRCPGARSAHDQISSSARPARPGVGFVLDGRGVGRCQG